jgi:phage head maturation protease
MSPQTNDDGYLIEFISLGGSVKVTAVDPRTLLEVSVIVPPALPQEEAAGLAIRKLHYMQEKSKNQS